MKNNLSRIQRRLVLIAVFIIVIIAIVLYCLLLNGSDSAQEIPATSSPAIKLAILNGCGVPGAATEVKEYFINHNPGQIDVVSWKNVDRDLFIYNKSIIVIKKDDPEKVDFLKQFTGIERKIFALDNNAIEDLQIVLGDDYKEIFK